MIMTKEHIATLLDRKESQTTKLCLIPFSIGVLAIADTHMTLRSQQTQLAKALQKESIDVCLLLGDIAEEEMEIIQALVPNEIPMYGVLGNHDGWELYDQFGIEHIHGRVVQVKGVRIAVISGSIRYKDVDAPLLTDEESCAIAESMAPADILISHDSPKGIHARKDFAHSGLQGVTDYCTKNNVPLNLHGHHHINRKYLLNTGTASVCCHGIAYLNTVNTDKVVRYTDCALDNVE